ncbi:uncharacterized protein LOC120842476 [Ixodes scapularis]|uniref:uncharacterized protein LOC120842476 n=1 Tax=Ixodes scapularis TaxID=6945 RepID=UPI001A9F1073|nr:uncharacterized protein LOC120842476 [Ixodes scapularis]
MASVNMEKEGLIKQLEFFKEKCMLIFCSTFIVLPYCSKLCTQLLFCTTKFYGTGVNKKMAAASKRAGCQELQIWVQATTNHLYYSAKAGAGNRKLTADVWLSLQNHAINKHAGHGGSYPRCLHNEIPERAHDYLKKIPVDKRLLKDVGQMSPHGQTYVLEAFQSVLINVASKSQAFPPAGMLER